MRTINRKHKYNMSTEPGFQLRSGFYAGTAKFEAELFFYEEPDGAYYRSTAAVFVLRDGRMFVGVSMYSLKDAAVAGECRLYNELSVLLGHESEPEPIRLDYDQHLGRLKAYGRAASATIRRPDHPDGTVNDTSEYSRIDREKAAMHLARYVISLRKEQLGPGPHGGAATSSLFMVKNIPVQFVVDTHEKAVYRQELDRQRQSAILSHPQHPRQQLQYVPSHDVKTVDDALEALLHAVGGKLPSWLKSTK